MLCTFVAASNDLMPTSTLLPSSDVEHLNEQKEILITENEERDHDSNLHVDDIDFIIDDQYGKLRNKQVNFSGHLYSRLRSLNA